MVEYRAALNATWTSNVRASIEALAEAGLYLRLVGGGASFVHEYIEAAQAMRERIARKMRNDPRLRLADGTILCLLHDSSSALSHKEWARLRWVEREERRLLESVAATGSDKFETLVFSWELFIRADRCLSEDARRLINSLMAVGLPRHAAVIANKAEMKWPPAVVEAYRRSQDRTEALRMIEVLKGLSNTAPALPQLQESCASLAIFLSFPAFRSSIKFGSGGRGVLSTQGDPIVGPDFVPVLPNSVPASVTQPQGVTQSTPSKCGLKAEVHRTASAQSPKLPTVGGVVRHPIYGRGTVIEVIAAEPPKLFVMFGGLRVRIGAGDLT
jgi:hypothetical protein